MGDLQKELRGVYAGEAFQDSLQAMFAETEGGKPAARRKALLELTLQQQKDILPRYGFEATQEGSMNMVIFFMSAYQVDPEIQALFNDSNLLLAPPQAEVRWTVVGGGAQGGIVVRKTADLASPQLGRVSTGAVLRQKNL